MHGTFRLSTIALAGLALAGASASAQSKPDEERLAAAKAYFEAGKDAYRAAKYKDAIDAFEEAQRLVPRPAIVFSTAQAYRLQYYRDFDARNVREALRLYKQYLRQAPRGARIGDAVEHIATLEPIWQDAKKKFPDSEQMQAKKPRPTRLMVTSKTPGARAGLAGSELSEVPAVIKVEPGKHEIEIAAPGFFTQTVTGVAVENTLIVVPVDLEPKPARLSFKAPQGAQIAIDGRLMSGTGVDIAAGKHLVTVTRRGHYPFARELTLSRGESLTVETPLQITTQRKLSYYFLAGAGAVALAGGVTSLLSLRAQGKAQDIIDTRESGTNITLEQLDEHNALIAERNDYRTATYIILAAALAVGATGAALYFIDTPRAEAPLPPKSAPAVVPAVSTNAVGAAVIGRFE